MSVLSERKLGQGRKTSCSVDMDALFYIDRTSVDILRSVFTLSLLCIHGCMAGAWLGIG